MVEDEGWHTAQAEKDVEMALLFPFAPNATPSLTSEGGQYYFTKPVQRKRQPEQLNWRNMLTPSEQSQSTAQSPVCESHSVEEDMTLKSPPISGYESLGESDFASEDPYFPTASPVTHKARADESAGEFEGVEGIYRFLQVCDEARR